jgi:hypothetical protein
MNASARAVLPARTYDSASAARASGLPSATAACVAPKQFALLLLERLVALQCLLQVRLERLIIAFAEEQLGERLNLRPQVHR